MADQLNKHVRTNTVAQRTKGRCGVSHRNNVGAKQRIDENQDSKGKKIC